MARGKLGGGGKLQQLQRLLCFIRMVIGYSFLQIKLVKRGGQYPLSGHSLSAMLSQRL